MLSNICDVGDKVIVPTTGFFSSRWTEVARALAIEVIEVPSQPGTDADFAAILELLKADAKGEIKAVLSTQTDTGSGVEHDIPAFRRCLDEAGHPALLVADCIASLGASQFRMDGWGVDVTLTGSQKALMMPPGLALVAANEKARRVASAVKRHRFYWDWDKRSSKVIYHKFGGTLPIHMLFGLRAALDLVLEEGLERRVHRHKLVSPAVQKAATEWAKGGDMEFFVRDPARRSASVTAIRVTSSDNPAERIRKTARNHFGVSVAGGLADLENRILRIGHLGDVNTPMILGCLGGMEATFAHLGVRYQSGLNAAARALNEPLGGKTRTSDAPAQLFG